MPLYSFWCPGCDKDTTQICKMEDRDGQWCQECGARLIRGIDSPGMVWSPTRNSGMST